MPQPGDVDHMMNTRRLIRLLLLGFLASLAVMGWSSQAYGQLPSLGGSVAAETRLPPSGVSRYGALEVAWVKSPLGGENLFQIASPTVIDRSSLDGAQLPVEVRSHNIEDLLRLEISRFRQNALSRLFAPFTAAEAPAPRSAQVIVSTLQGLTVVQVTSTTSSRPLTIATVTQADANFYSETPEQVAQQWQTAIAGEIQQAETLYSPEVLLQRLQQTIAILLGILLLTGLLALIYRRLGKRQAQLQRRYASKAEVSPPEQSLAEQQKTVADSSHPAERFEAAQISHWLQQQLSLQRRLTLYKFARWLLIWLAVLVWYVGLYLLTTRLPILMQWSRTVLTQPLSLIVIWFVVSLLIRISNSLIQRSVSAWKENAYLSFGVVQRKALRSQTVSGALQGLASCTLVLIGILLTLTEFGLPVPSLLAGGAVIGLAISLGAQNLIKDLVNGCLILLEDQFAVGDVITLNGESGLVERLNLRLTQLRNPDGELITIPNSQIGLVKNQTSTWSRVNLGINVAYSTDLDHAIAVIDKVATQLSQDPDWQSLILEPPQVLGVDAFGDNSITIRLWMQTEPLQQWPVGREFRRRLKKAFDQAGISIPFPQRSIWFENGLPEKGEIKRGMV
ncbi:MAG: mechanosensitive ion channel family protein [Leptolyngbya sp. SIO4C1]|nr:mechanosensitive ion channel family protein [Leptolyngbya sp. SIO4C1]